MSTAAQNTSLSDFKRNHVTFIEKLVLLYQNLPLDLLQKLSFKYREKLTEIGEDTRNHTDSACKKCSVPFAVGHFRIRLYPEPKLNNNVKNIIKRYDKKLRLSKIDYQKYIAYQTGCQIKTVTCNLCHYVDTQFIPKPKNKIVKVLPPPATEPSSNISKNKIKKLRKNQKKNKLKEILNSSLVESKSKPVRLVKQNEQVNNIISKSRRIKINKFNSIHVSTSRFTPQVEAMLEVKPAIEKSESEKKKTKNLRKVAKSQSSIPTFKSDLGSFLQNFL